MLIYVGVLGLQYKQNIKFYTWNDLLADKAG